jgi:uncharacterized membrane protein
MHGLSALLKRFEWIHTGLGILGNTLFVVGSVFFLYESLKTEGVWLFIVGSALMLVGALGSGIVKLWRAEERREESERQAA